MDDNNTFNPNKVEIINPLLDEVHKKVEPLLKVAMNELGYKIPLYVRLYNQIRFYERYGKLQSGYSVASKETLAEQFNVSIKQIDQAYHNLTNKYKLGKWVTHSTPVYRNVTRTWASNARLKQNIRGYYAAIDNDGNYYGVTPELLQRNSKTITVEQLVTDEQQGSQTKDKVRERNTGDAKAPGAIKPKKKSVKSEHEEYISKSYFEFINKHKIPKRNVTQIKGWIKNLAEEMSEEKAKWYFNLLLNHYEEMKDIKFMPRILEDKDIYFKRLKIEAAYERANNEPS